MILSTEFRLAEMGMERGLEAAAPLTAKEK